MKNLELISKIALTFVNSEAFDVQIKSVLDLVGEYLEVSRIYIFIDNKEGTIASRIHEWCNDNVKHLPDKMQNISYDRMPSWKKALSKDGRIISENMEDLPSDIKSALSPVGIKSLIIYPIFIENAVKGFIGYDESRHPRTWKESELKLLKSISAIISTAYESKLSQDSCKSSEDNINNFFNTVDDLMIIGNMQGNILHANRAVTDKLGYTLDELRKMNILDLHSEGKRGEAQRIITEMFKGNLSFCPLEIETKSGKRIPVETRIWIGKWNGQDCIFGISKDLSKEQEALQKFTKLFEHNPALMTIISLDDGKISDVNEAFIEKLGYSRDEIIGKTSPEIGLFVLPDKQAKIADTLIKTGSIKNIELQIKCKNGTILHGLFFGETIDSQGKAYFITVMVDITEQVALAKKVESQKQRLENIITGTRLGTWEWNIQTGETIYNERWAEIIGYTLDELGPVNIDTWRRFAHPDDLKESERLLQEHFNRKTDFYEFEGRMKHKSGNWIWVHDRGRVIEWNPDGKPLFMFGTHSDITEKKEMEEKIRQISIRDPLTNIYNRRYIFERLEGIISESIRYDKIFSISIIDLDNFKNINDTHGHQAGDYVLKEFTQIINNNNLRSYDLFGRFGGEEFIIVSVNIDKRYTSSTIERILEITRNTKFNFNGSDISLTFSCGIADSSEHNKDVLTADMMIEDADSRLYEAKKTGRDRVVILD